jgi:hypothetical protein
MPQEWALTEKNTKNCVFNLTNANYAVYKHLRAHNQFLECMVSEYVSLSQSFSPHYFSYLAIECMFWELISHALNVIIIVVTHNQYMTLELHTYNEMNSGCIGAMLHSGHPLALS